jgi:UDP-N-acetylmuramyl pentapeptide synthase
LSDSAASFFESPTDAGDFLATMVRPGDTVLFKGSRGVEIEKAMGRAFGESRS